MHVVVRLVLIGVCAELVSVCSFVSINIGTFVTLFELMLVSNERFCSFKHVFIILRFAALLMNQMHCFKLSLLINVITPSITKNKDCFDFVTHL